MAILKASSPKPSSYLPDLWKEHFPEQILTAPDTDSLHFNIGRSTDLAPGFDYGLDGSITLLILLWQLRQDMTFPLIFNP